MRKAYLFAVAVALALTFTAGCRKREPSGRGGRPVSSTVDRGQNPEALLRNAVESRTALASIAGKGVMRIVDQPSKFGLTVNANIVADNQNRLRIKADKLAGAIQAFDVVMLDDDIGFYIPTQKTLYHGKVRDLQGFSFRFDPDEVLNEMLRPQTHLLSKKWRVAKDGPSKGGIVLEEDAPANRPRLRVAINERSGTIASITHLDAGGQPTMVKRYDDYRGMGGKGSRMNEGSGAVFPYLIAFSWPRDKRSMEMQFKQMQPNARVTEDDFEMATSSDTKNRPLREARMDSDN